MVYLGKSEIKDMYYGAKSELYSLALSKRKHPTEAERILWQSLRKFRSEEFIFRRQHPVEMFIVDFYCHKIKLVIEVDGEYHEDEIVHNHDENRTAEFERLGIKVIRFRNAEILNNIDYVISQVRKKIDEQSSPALSGSGGQEGVRPS